MMNPHLVVMRRNGRLVMQKWSELNYGISTPDEYKKRNNVLGSPIKIAHADADLSLDDLREKYGTELASIIALAQ